MKIGDVAHYILVDVAPRRLRSSFGRGGQVSMWRRASRKSSTAPNRKGHHTTFRFQ